MVDDKRVSIKTKLLRDVYFNTFLTLLVALLALFCASYFELKKHSLEGAETLARVAASMVNGDEHERISTSLDRQGKAYDDIKNALFLIKRADPEMKTIYTTRKRDDSNVEELVVNGTENGTQLRAYKVFDSNIYGQADIKNKADQVVGKVNVGLDSDMMVEHEKQLLVIGLAVFLCTGIVTAYFTNKRIGKIMMPLSEINYGISKVMNGRLQHRLNIKTGDEFEDVGNLINKFSDVMVDYRVMLEKDLEITREERQALFKAYSSVIFSMTQGKFDLISDPQPLYLEKAGELFGQVKLSNPESVREARDFAEKYLEQKTVPPKLVERILVCISEAATNAIKHATNGVMQIGKIGTTENLIRVIVSDQGHGMDLDRLPNMIFLNGFSTKISMGFGFTLIYKYADNIHLATSNQGTFIAMDFKY